MHVFGSSIFMVASASILGISLGIIGAIAAGVILFAGIVIGLPVYLFHRRRIIEMEREHENQDINELREKVTRLEEHCEKLQDQIHTLSSNLSDEGRELDQRLTKLLDTKKDQAKQQDEASQGPKLQRIGTPQD